MRLALLALLLVPTIAAAQAGRVLMAAGEAVVVRGTQEIPAAPGTAVEAGDTIRVGTRSSVQIRMSDGSVFALRAGTIFRIDQYAHTGGEGERSVFSLVKGGLRTVTGAIARTPGAPGPVAAADPAQPARKDFAGSRRAEEGTFARVARAVTGAALKTDTTRHAVQTPNGMIGVRGTHYTVVHCDNDCFAGGVAPNGTYVGTSDGFVGFVNNAGDREFGPQSFFHVASLDSAPTTLVGPPAFLYDRLESRERARGQTSAESTEGMSRTGLNAESRPSEVPAAPVPPTFVATEEKNSAGDPAVVAGHGASPTAAFLGAFLNASPTGVSTPGAFITDAELTITGTGDSRQVNAFAIPPGPNASNGVAGTTTPTSVTNETAAGNALGAYWGRWDAGTIMDANGNTTISANNQFHYLISPQTPPDIIAAKTGTSTFFIVGGTTPTNSSGQTGSFFMGSGLTVDFTARTVALGASSLSFPGPQNWTFSASSPAPIQFAPGGAFISTSASGSCAGGVCATFAGAVLIANGIFLGPGDHIGMGLQARTISGPAASAQTIQIFSCAPSC